MTSSQSSSSSTSGVGIENSFEVYSHESLEQEHRRPLEENGLFGADSALLWNNATTLPPTIAPTTLPAQPTPADPMTIALTIALPFLLLMTVAMCSRGNTPGREYWRGAQIAANARRIREQRRIKSQRKALTPEERSLQIHTSMRCMYVVEKDSRTGYLKLSEESKPLVGPDTTDKTTSSTSKSDIFQSKPDPEGQSPNNDDINENPTLSNDIRLIRSKGSHDTADTVPDDDLPSPPTSGNNNAACIDNQDEENVCYICLDNFEVGDRVMWSRLHKNCDKESCQNDDTKKSTQGCRHVFHQECIMPWLLEKRENECPSCRAPFLEDAPEPKQLTPEEEADAILAMYERNTVEVLMGSDDVHHVAGGTSSEPVDIEAMVKSIDDDSDDNSDDVLDIEEGYSFVIDKGLIKSVPNFHGTLAVSVPFRRQSLARPTTIATNNTADTSAESLEEDDHDNCDQDR